MIYENITSLIGNTPLLRLSRYARARGLKAEIIAKLEYLNPAGSIKDRVALGMVLDAEERGLLQPGGTIIEPTLGNTGIGLHHARNYERGEAQAYKGVRRRDSAYQRRRWHERRNKEGGGA